MQMNKKARKKYAPEFKKEAVELVTVQGYGIAETARNLGITANMLSRWKKRIEEQSSGTRLNTDEQSELQGLRQEVRRLRMEREILKKAAAFFANETK